jgi:hypothetical protein
LVFDVTVFNRRLAIAERVLAWLCARSKESEFAFCIALKDKAAIAFCIATAALPPLVTRLPASADRAV